MRLPLPQLQRRDVLVAAVAALVAVSTLILYAARLLDNIERQTVDQRFSLRGARSPGSQIVIVEIDQNTFQAVGVRPPLPRAAYAAALDRVRAGSPRLIGIDALFEERTDAADDNALLAAVARDGPVLLATEDHDQGPTPVPAGVRDAPGAVIAAAGMDTDPGGVLRRMMYAQVDLRTFAVRAAEMIRDQPVDPADFPGNHAWIDFRGPPDTFPHYSFTDVSAGKIPSSTFTGKAVLIGVTDPAAKDVFVTSMSSLPIPGVEVQANALWTALHGFPLKSVDVLIDIALTLALIAIPAAVAARRSGLITLAVAGGLLVTFVVGAQLAFDAGWITTVTYPIVGLVVTAAGLVGVDAYMERRQRAALERALGDLLPPQSPPAFFISYRRSQNAWQARDIRRELTRRYGDASVFMDTSSIEYGETFPDQIATAIRGCSVMLVLIGPHWLDHVGGTRRIDDPNDWVRQEIEAGLQRQEAVVVPVLLDGARAPTDAELPPATKGLATRNAVAITGDDLPAEIDKLLRSVERGQRRATQSGSHELEKS